MKILEVTNLCKTYGKGDTMVKALDNVSFSVEKGEFLAIIGPSGSGKSTLLHILGGVDVPTSGSVVINQTDISNLDETALAIFRRRQIGLIYQFSNPRRFTRVSICFLSGFLPSRRSGKVKFS